MAFEQLGNNIVGQITFPFTNYLYNRPGIYKKYRSLRSTDHASQDELTAIQLDKLKALIAYANTYVPHYTQVFKEIGLEPGDIKSLDDIKKIPTLNRDTITDHREELVDYRHRASIPIADARDLGPGQPLPLGRFRKDKLVRNASSGSTGIPAVFYEDGTTPAWNWAHEFRLKGWFGFEPGEREARFVRLSVDYMPSDRTSNMRRRLWHQLIVPGVDLNDELYEIALQKIKEYRPRLFQGFTTALTGLAEYIQRTGADISGYEPELIMGWAAPLYAHEEYLLKQVFKCETTNIYGSREVGHIGGLCPEGAMHTNQENYLVEVDGDDGAGELLITPLFITPMPFIRYRIGDMGEVADSDCACGLKHKVVKELLGRKAEVFVTDDGHMIAPNFWCRAFMGAGPGRTVKRFQVVYRKDNSFSLRVVPRENYQAENMEQQLRDVIVKSFGENTKFEFDYVDHIDPLPNGKYQMVVNETELKAN